MPGTLTMTDKQHAPAGVTILDLDGQPLDAVTAGYKVAFASADPTVADFVVGPDGLNGDVTSGKVGTTSIVATVTFPDASVKTDTLSVAVLNSAAGAPNFTAGVPVDEV
jgi:hypothetical protein